MDKELAIQALTRQWRILRKSLDEQSDQQTMSVWDSGHRSGCMVALKVAILGLQEELSGLGVPIESLAEPVRQEAEETVES